MDEKSEEGKAAVSQEKVIVLDSSQLAHVRLIAVGSFLGVY